MPLLSLGQAAEAVPVLGDHQEVDGRLVCVLGGGGDGGGEVCGEGGAPKLSDMERGRVHGGSTAAGSMPLLGSFVRALGRLQHKPVG